MCKKYELEFWTPLPTNPTAESERTVRGYAQVPPAPGQGDIVRFYRDCRDRETLMMTPCCPAHKITNGGTIDGAIQAFFKMDPNCKDRLQRFEAEFNKLRWQLRHAELRDEAKQYQRNIAVRLGDVWREWVNCYEHHKECPMRRENHPTYRKLRRMITVGPTLGREERLATNPHTPDKPQVGFERF